MPLYRVFLTRKTTIHESLALVIETDLPRERIAEKALEQNAALPAHEDRRWVVDTELPGDPVAVKIETLLP